MEIVPISGEVHARGIQGDRPRDELIWLQVLRREYGEQDELPCATKSKKRKTKKTADLNDKIKESQSYEDEEKEKELGNNNKEKTTEANPGNVRQPPRKNTPLPEGSGGDPGENRPKK